MGNAGDMISTPMGLHDPEWTHYLTGVQGYITPRSPPLSESVYRTVVSLTFLLYTASEKLVNSPERQEKSRNKQWNHILV